MKTYNMSDYWDALERLLKGRPERIPKGTKLSNDAVSLEAGRGKGAIKRVRPEFKSLIEAIDKAKSAQKIPATSESARIEVLTKNVKELQARLDATLAREMSLVYELFEMKKHLADLTGAKVMPIRTKK